MKLNKLSTSLLSAALGLTLVGGTVLAADNNNGKHDADTSRVELPELFGHGDGEGSADHGGNGKLEDSSKDNAGVTPPKNDGSKKTEGNTVKPGSKKPEGNAVKPGSKKPEESAVKPGSNKPEENAAKPGNNKPEENVAKPGQNVKGQNNKGGQKTLPKTSAVK